MQPIRIRRRHLPFGLSTDWYDNKYTKQRSRSTVIVFFPLGPRERRQHRYRHLIPYPSMYYARIVESWDEKPSTIIDCTKVRTIITGMKYCYFALRRHRNACFILFFQNKIKK